MKKLELYVFWEVSFQLCNASAPVSSGLLWNELDIQEGSLARTIDVSGSSSSNDAWRDICYDIL